ncbi:hypothetical protein DJ030_00515 [bacterium endosymbiont of Escarpia laminata]|nr:MAG: hypothetical protein DJ030_00515 [bacterium endosymbiont of Escarpia laminata]
MALARDNKLRLTTWILVVVLLLSWGEGLLAGFGQDHRPMGEGSHRVMGDDQHCQMPGAAILQHDCGLGCFNLQQALPQRDSDLLDIERIDQPALIYMDMADPAPVRGPPRDEILPFSKIPPVPIPPRLNFCCLRI